MNWDEVLQTLESIEQYIEAQGDDDHDDEEVTDSITGMRYCLGCQVGAAAQGLRFDLETYLEARQTILDLERGE